jgi:hypothetical protein
MAKAVSVTPPSTWTWYVPVVLIGKSQSHPRQICGLQPAELGAVELPGCSPRS